MSPQKSWFDIPIEDLNLSMRGYNALRRSGLATVGAMLRKSEGDLLALRNFGRQSYDELRDRLDELGIVHTYGDWPGGVSDEDITEHVVVEVHPIEDMDD